MLNFKKLLGNLEFESDLVDPKKLKKIEVHLAKFETFSGEFPANEAMVNRLKQALLENRPISGADLSFYYHELKEAEFMESGLSYQESHLAALNYYQVSPFSLYHPDVILNFPDEFNKNWLSAWGL